MGMQEELLHRDGDIRPYSQILTKEVETNGSPSEAPKGPVSDIEGDLVLLVSNGRDSVDGTTEEP